MCTLHVQFDGRYLFLLFAIHMFVVYYSCMFQHHNYLCMFQHHDYVYVSAIVDYISSNANVCCLLVHCKSDSFTRQQVTVLCCMFQHHIDGL